jgi:SAM-dependent methyltransferase
MAERSGSVRWRGVAKRYLETIQGPYHANRLAMVQALCATVPLSGARCLDFGCGDGVFMAWLADRDATVAGADINPTMVAAARDQLAALGDRLLFVRQCGAEGLAELPDAGLDAVFALNVLAYLEPDEEAAFYRHARRMLRPGGQLIVTHSNELFDLFTFNRYTVNFVRKYFSFDAGPTEIAPLLTHPDKPDRAGFHVRENPLSYRYKLRQRGFDERQQEFAILHEQPPLLTPEIDFDAINTRRYPETLGWPDEERWKLMFVCSIFGSRSVVI